MKVNNHQDKYLMKNKIHNAAQAAKNFIDAMEKIGLAEYIQKPLLVSNSFDEKEGLPGLEENSIRPKFIPQFKIGQTVFYFGHAGRVWDGIIKKVSGGEILVQGNTLGWYTADLLFHTLGQAYTALDQTSDTDLI
jgi:hypothetical protein